LGIRQREASSMFRPLHEVNMPHVDHPGVRRG
jgi:hypothetical protein